MLVVRCFGKYLQMMDVLKAISNEVFDCMLELYYFYLDTVWHFFVRENKLTYPETVLSSRARAALHRLSRTKEAPPETLAPANPEMAKRPTILYEIAQNSPPKLSSNCDTTSESGLFGLGARVLGMESLTFLATVLRSLKPNFQKRLLSSRQQFFEGFYGEMVASIPELRWFVYKNSASTLMPLAPIISKIGKVKWDPKEILSQHNAYVDDLVLSLKLVSQRIAILGQQRLPLVAYDSIWTEITHEINVMFVNGFSNTKKCSMEGRALMQLDYREYLSKLSKMCTVKPNTEHVDIFLHAFYLLEDEIEKWLRENRKRYVYKMCFLFVGMCTTRVAQAPAIH